MRTEPCAQLLESTVFPGAPESARAARRWLRGLLRHHPRGDTAELLLSELVSNALVHTTSTAITVTMVATRGGAVRIEVIDEGAATTPCTCKHLAESTGLVADALESGRGMLIVRSEADRWGFAEDGYGCKVWFCLD
jgi:anti-sigma regulatory factor (Ser/Thr protein kinase)